MAEKACNLIKNGGGIGNIQTLADAGSSSAISISGNWTYYDIPNTTFTLSKGDWLITVFMYIAFSSSNNVWIDLVDGTLSDKLFDFNPDRIASTQYCLYSQAILKSVNSDTSYRTRISSYSSQTYTPYTVKIMAIKL